MELYKITESKLCKYSFNLLILIKKELLMIDFDFSLHHLQIFVII